VSEERLVAWTGHVLEQPKVEELSDAVGIQVECLVSMLVQALGSLGALEQM
jgi:hypothetical protein